MYVACFADTSSGCGTTMLLMHMISASISTTAFFHPASIVALVLFFLPLSLITSDSPLSFIFDSFTYDVDKRIGNFYNIPIKTAG